MRTGESSSGTCRSTTAPRPAAAEPHLLGALGTGVLVVLAGLPGTGKTTLSRVIARELGAALLRVDAIEAGLLRGGAVRAPVGAAGYAAAHAVAADCLTAGTPVLVDAVNPVAEARTGWRDLAAAHGVALRAVEVQLGDAEEHRRRVQARRSDLDGLVVPTWEQVLSWDYQPWDEERDGARLLVDGGDTERALDSLRAHVGLRPAG